MIIFDPFSSGKKSILKPEVILAKTIKNIKNEGNFVDGIKKTGENAVKPLQKVAYHNSLGSRNIPKSSLQPGDILAAKRASGVYYHFAVYIGNNRVIHYAAKGGDFGSEISIHEAPYSEFEGNSKEIFVLDFPETASDLPKKIQVGSSSVYGDLAGYSSFDWLSFIRELKYKLYSPQETVNRARSRIGETKYSLVANNCEHFAIWCKTGIHESHQVNAIMEVLLEQQSKKVVTY